MTEIEKYLESQRALDKDGKPDESCLVSKCTKA